jgi:predicted permease
MPAAVTTFSIAHAAGIEERRVAAVVVRSSLLCLLTLPVVLLAVFGL